MCFELRSVLSDGISARAVASVSACAHATSSLVAHAFISARMEESLLNYWKFIMGRVLKSLKFKTAFGTR